MKAIPFLPTGETNFRYPLKRYLPFYHAGVISNWLQQNSKPKGNVLDPLGSNPCYALEAAEGGFRVFQAQKNPILQLMTQVLAKGYSEKQFQNAIRLLLDQEWHGEKLGNYIQKAYRTECRNCGKSVDAEGFVWKKDSKEPASVVILCPYCGEGGTYPTNEADIAHLQQLGNTAIYHLRALQRCLVEGIDVQKNLEYALACYTPRALHLVVILFNALDQLMIPAEERSMISAVLLEVFDQATSLWHWPARDFRPQQLVLPSSYFEKNIYRIIPQAIRTWTDFKKTCEVVNYPVIPDQPRSICLFERKTTNALVSIQTDQQGLPVFCSFPRPNQAFWTFSAIWSAWLFGKKAATGMLSTLARQRYGWYWFAQAIATSFSSVKNEITEKDSVFGICTDFTPSYLLAILLGASDAGFTLTGGAFQSSANVLQLVWKYTQEEGEAKTSAELETARPSLIRYLDERAEPATFRELFSVYCTSPAIHAASPVTSEGETSDYYNKVLNDLHGELGNTALYRSITGSNISSTRWMLADRKNESQPLDDRIEQEIVNAIRQNAQLNFRDLYAHLCQVFPGFLTPDREYCKACLESYATRTNLALQEYERDEDEEPAKRAREEKEIGEWIGQIGRKIGVTVQFDQGIRWLDAKGKPLYRFHISTTAIFSELMRTFVGKDQGMPVFVFPASRSRLIVLKKGRNPFLSETIEQGGHLVKFRHIRKITEQEQFTLQAWQDILDVDPPLWDPPAQLKFL
ncbi:MAG: hypothetical protein GYA45_02730 [Pelolinea sp.]|jgi:hypothetical protein|nr:hypothetical protein [Pelolinea sp.]